MDLISRISLKNVINNDMNNKCNNNIKQLNYVPIDRLYEIARQLAEYEFNNRENIEICLLDTNCDYYMNYKSMNNSLNDNNSNYCEVVSVPTSTHVAQIVGKQGSKIKLLRAKSSTYIQTPISGEEPVFIITGRREDVLKVKAEILSASEHFTYVNEQRKQKLDKNMSFEGSICLNLNIPSFVIGLIVGRNGITIRNIQKMTNTYIETPKSGESNTFRITGSALNVESAKNSIMTHIKSKTNRKFTANHSPNGDIQLIFEVEVNQKNYNENNDN